MNQFMYFSGVCSNKVKNDKVVVAAQKDDASKFNRNCAIINE